MNTTKKLAAVCAVLALPLAACSDDADDDLDDIDVTIDDDGGSVTTIDGSSLPTVATSPAGAGGASTTMAGGDTGSVGTSAP